MKHAETVLWPCSDGKQGEEERTHARKREKQNVYMVIIQSVRVCGLRGCVCTLARMLSVFVLLSVLRLKKRERAHTPRANEVEVKKEHAREKVGICVRVRQNKRHLIFVVPVCVCFHQLQTEGARKTRELKKERENEKESRVGQERQKRGDRA